MPASNEGSRVSTLLDLSKAWRWTFLTRKSELSKIHGGQKKALSLVCSVRTGPDVVRALIAESKVFVQFLRYTKLADRLGIDKVEDLARALFLCWTGFENLRQIDRNMGHRSKMIYFTDESALHLDEDSLLAYYRSFHALRNPELLARNAVGLLAEVLRLATLLHDLRLDETEQATLLMLYLLRYATTKFDVNDAASKLMSAILKDLHEHYDSTHSDASLRTASMILILAEFEKGLNYWEEHNILMRLNGQEPVADFFDTSPTKPGAVASEQMKKYYLGAVCLEN